MFDTIIPIGETCNITFLLQNTKIKKYTTLFEWFVSPSLIDITNILIKIKNNTDKDIIKTYNNHIFIGDKIYSGHYNYENFKSIYERRKNRLIDSIKSSKKILFYRFEINNNIYCKQDIDNFINTILDINPNIEDIKILLITTNKLEFTHSSLINKIYIDTDKDYFCKGEKMNNFFINTLIDVGYDLNNTIDISFTDKSIL